MVLRSDEFSALPVVWALFTVFTLTGLYLWQNKVAIDAGKRLPPGPPRLPLIGSLLQMPKDTQWHTFEQWRKEHNSELIHFDVLGNHFIVVNTLNAAKELFENRSAIYSDRPFTPSASIHLGYHWAMPLLPYGDRLRALRKGFHTFLQPNSAKDYRPLERKATLQLLHNVMTSPEEFMEHIRLMAGTIILGIAYGINVKPHNDPYIETVERGLKAVATITEPRAQIFDLLPFLIYVPSWVPGVGWKKFAEDNRHLSTDVLEHPYLATKEAMASGTGSQSVAGTMLTEMESREELTPEGELFVKELTGNMYAAGADTTVCALENFILAMILYPDAQRKAQAEIDAIVGHDRLPDFSDEKLLPYVGALVKEVMRWRNVAPLGVPHRLIVDDVWEDYFIPAGSTVLSNIWSILHDESVFGPDALSFNPERYLNSHLPDPEVTFGFGRRICPGRHMARDSIWLAVAVMLSTLDISRAVDDNGKEIEPADDHTSGTVALWSDIWTIPFNSAAYMAMTKRRYPVPFKCTIKPRSDSAEKLTQLIDVYEV